MEPMEGASTMEQAILKRAAKRKVPVNGSLELLPLCNMNCDMCYVRLSRGEMEARGRLRTAEEWLDLGRQMREAGVLFILLTGGEPLLYPDFRRLYLELKRMGFILTINTNGTLIDQDWADFFGANKPRRINITLYGADEAAYQELCHYPGGFARTISGIRLLKARGVDVKLGGSLTRANEKDMDRIQSLSRELDVPVRIDTYMMPATRERERPYDMQSRVDPYGAARVRVLALKEEMGPELFRAYVEKTIWEVDHILPEEGPGHMSCLAGSCSFTVNWQGELRPCVILSSPAAPVFEIGFQAAWQRVREEADQILLSAQCSACKLRPVCRTCAACALVETGYYDGVPKYMCEYAARTLELLRKEQIFNPVPVPDN